MKELTEDYTDSIAKDDKRYVEAKAAGLKAISSWNATQTIQECREACGGKGYLVENQFSDLKNDTDIFSTFEGDNTVLLQLVAKGLLSDMRRQFLDEGYRAVFRYITQRVATSWDEINPFASRRTDAEYLTDHGVLFHAFTYRERKLLDTVSRRMKAYIGRNVHPSEAFLKCQNHMIELAEAHIERVILKASYRTLREINNEEVKALFVKMHELYALSTIERHKGFYLENDYMQGSQSKAVRRVVNKLCSDLRDHAEALVEGFGIPKELIVAPIALNDD